MVAMATASDARKGAPAADAYEVADVKRVTVRLGSGIDAFGYVNARP
jgi:hypothetical protein